jgi:2-polyprenyl-6-methoxyphenol hydroxylase-like FAD-dependent oxidoreductase
MSSLRAIVVGGSLSGLSTALALAADGAEVVVFERDRELGAGGAGLGVERSLLERVTDASPFGAADVPALPVITSNRDSTAWMLIYRWLRSVIDRRPRITLHYGAEATQVRADASGATVVTPAGIFAADLVIGAPMAIEALSAATSRRIGRMPRSPATCFGAGWWRRPRCPRRRPDRAGFRVSASNGRAPTVSLPTTFLARPDGTRNPRGTAFLVV